LPLPLRRLSSHGLEIALSGVEEARSDRLATAESDLPSFSYGLRDSSATARASLSAASGSVASSADQAIVAVALVANSATATPFR